MVTDCCNDQLSRNKDVQFFYNARFFPVKQCPTIILLSTAHFKSKILENPALKLCGNVFNQLKTLLSFIHFYVEKMY